MIRSFIGIGSNLGNPPERLACAVRALAELPGSRLAAVSPAYWSSPWGGVEQPDFLNAAAALDTALSAPRVLAALRAIESGQGRDRSREVRWGPRRLDLDLLLYGDRRIDLPELKVPHPELTRRAFVKVPLADLDPDLRIPGAGPLADFIGPDDRRGLRPAGIDLPAAAGSGLKTASAGEPT